jgi:uncharacterized damage-inducible protein DinB
MAELKTIDALLSRFAAIPGHIAQAVEGRNEEELQARPAQDEWSITEIFAHMRAVDDIFTLRIYAILVRDSTPLAAYDERLWAEVARYAEGEFHASLHLFTLRRAELINTLRHIAPEDWQRVGIHEELGAQSVLSIVSGLVEHEEEHTAQMAAPAHR